MHQSISRRGGDRFLGRSVYACKQTVDGNMRVDEAGQLNPTQRLLDIRLSGASAALATVCSECTGCSVDHRKQNLHVAELTSVISPSDGNQSKSESQQKAKIQLSIRNKPGLMVARQDGHQRGLRPRQAAERKVSLYDGRLHDLLASPS